MTNTNEKPMTPAQRAALAEQREREAQQRLAMQRANAAPVRPQAPRPQAGNLSKEQRAALASAASLARKAPIRAAQKPTRQAKPNLQTTKEVPRQTAKRPTATGNSATTGEFPTFIHAGKGGYKPEPKARPARRRSHYRKLDPRFKAAVLAAAAVLVLLLVLLCCGVRYTKARFDGYTVTFFGTMHKGVASSGWISTAEGARGRLKDGVVTYSDGSVYVGELDGAVRSGEGTLTYANGDVYEGQFLRDKKNGYGKQTYATGDVYEGNFKDGVFSGHGEFRYANGATFSGEFANGKKNGEGTFVNGEASFTGSYVNDVKEGYGVQILNGGKEKYEGYYQNDLRNGYGIYYWLEKGERYEGNFKDGVASGEGTYYFQNGRSQSGKWENGVLIGS